MHGARCLRWALLARLGAAPRALRGRLPGVLLLAALASAGCRAPTKVAADAEVARDLSRRRARVPEVQGSLDLDAAETRARAARATAASQSEVQRVTLAQALALATAASREVRSQREDVYLVALTLTGARHDLARVPFATLGGEVSEDGGDATLSGGSRVGVSQALSTGGNVVLSLATDLLKNLTGNPLSTAQSILSLEALIPLARGSGRRVAREALTQAERDVVYALRSYARFQQRFTVDVAESFYRALAARDTWENEERTYASLERLEQRQRALGAQGAGRIPGFQVEQARQDTLRADDRRQRARAALEDALDGLRLLLGLAPTVRVEPAGDDLVDLARAGPLPAPYSVEEALRLATQRRLDLLNARDQVEDARRKAEVARDGLGPQIDLALGADLTTPSSKPLDLKSASERLSVGLALDLPLDRTPERNAWRTALIQAVRAWRAEEGLGDEIQRQIRADVRRLEEARRSHAIQGESVRLAERRAESTPLLLEAGQAQTRDVLDAENDLVAARNALTRALVDHAVARLRLELDVGTLRVDGAGQFTPTPPAAAPAPAPAGAPAAPGPGAAPPASPK